MSKNIGALIERVRDGWEPRAGDLVRIGGGKSLFVIVYRGRIPGISDVNDACIIFQVNGPGAREPVLWSFSEVDDVKHGCTFCGVSSDFHFVGFGPTVVRRPYVIFKRTAGALLRAGCRSFSTYAQAARHWRANGQSEKPVEKRALAKQAFDAARLRGWLKVKRQPPVKKSATKKRR